MNDIEMAKPAKLKGRDFTQQLTLAAVDHWVRLKYAVYTEIACEKWGRRRLDLYALNMRGEAIGIEVKSSKYDLQNDDKIHTYLPYCNQFYLCVPITLAEEAKVKAAQLGIGVVVINPTTGFLKVVKNCSKQEVDFELHYAMVLRMAWRNANYNRRNRKRRQRQWLE